MNSSKYFYPAEVYYHCSQLEQSIEEIKENTEHGLNVSKVRILLELVPMLIRKSIDMVHMSGQRIVLLLMNAREKIHILVKKIFKLLTVIPKLEEGKK